MKALIEGQALIFTSLQSLVIVVLYGLDYKQLIVLPSQFFIREAAALSFLVAKLKNKLLFLCTSQKRCQSVPPQVSTSKCALIIEVWHRLGLDLLC